MNCLASCLELFNLTDACAQYEFTLVSAIFRRGGSPFSVSKCQSPRPYILNDRARGRAATRKSYRWPGRPGGLQSRGHVEMRPAHKRKMPSTPHKRVEHRVARNIHPLDTSLNVINVPFAASEGPTSAKMRSCRGRAVAVLLGLLALSTAVRSSQDISRSVSSIGTRPKVFALHGDL